MAAEPIRATYWIETPLALESAAEVLAGQCTSTFVPLPGETDELRRRYRPAVERITALAPADAPSLPGSRPPQGAGGPVRYNRGEVVLAYPMENVGTNLPTLMAMTMGNFFDLSQLSGARLVDLDFPPAFAAAYPGPQFGVEGTRRLAGVHGRPVIGTIIKPAIGLAPERAAEMVREIAEAGIDFIKDDEMMANPPHSPIERRVAAVMRVINEVADRTGRKVMYAFNITDEPDAMLRHHDTVLAAGGTCVMVSLISVGLMGILGLRRRCRLPIHGHRNGWGFLSRCPALGVEFTAYQKLWRLVGADQLHVNGLQNKFWEPDDSVVRSIQACLAPAPGSGPVMPVVGSGQWGGQAPETYRRTRTVDLLYVCGGAIMAHPGGLAAGVRAIHQAWEAAVAGVSLETCAESHVELRQSLEKFGKLQR